MCMYAFVTFYLFQDIHSNLENNKGSERTFLTGYSFSLSFLDSSSSLQSLTSGLLLLPGLGLFSISLYSLGGLSSPVGLNITHMLLTPHIHISIPDPTPDVGSMAHVSTCMSEGNSNLTRPNGASDFLPQPCSPHSIPHLS